MWPQVGVQAKLNAMPRAPFFPKIQHDDTSFYMLGWGVPTFDALYSFQSLAHATWRRATATGTSAATPTAKMDALVEPDEDRDRPAKRKAAIRDALTIYREDVPHIPLHHQMIPWAMRSNVNVAHRANNRL